MSEPEVGINICASNPQAARALFEKCMKIVDTGKLWPDGKLVGIDGSGSAQVHTFESSRP
ncbi:Uncharacterised protein [Mycobacteroides abscessus subsp. abscessus]|nr:Uncharacterised protein [Mycobacteroides abscessus subsp. abscessus]